MVKIAKIIAKTALGDDFIPKEFRRAAAMAALSTAGETTQPGFDPIKRLRLNGRGP